MYDMPHRVIANMETMYISSLLCFILGVIGLIFRIGSWFVSGYASLCSLPFLITSFPSMRTVSMNP